jgi:hypothetical protein
MKNGHRMPDDEAARQDEQGELQVVGLLSSQVAVF